VPSPLVARQQMPRAALAEAAEASRGGTPHRLGRRLTCKLAQSLLAQSLLMPSLLMRQPGAGSDVPPSARALAIPIRSQELRSQELRARAGRVTRTLRLRRRPPRRPPVLPGHSLAGHSRAGRSQATA